jgi:hypothetical protein
MARTRQGDGPAGSLGDDDLQDWLKRSRAQLGATGINATFGRAPRIGGHPGPTWVTMTSATAYGRLIRAADGATTVRAHALPDSTPLLDERHPHTTIAQLDSIVSALTARRPVAGRA